MPGHDIIVVGASAGGVEALSKLARDLPADLPAALFVVLHVASHSPSVMPHILSRCGPLPATHAHDGDPIVRGRIYVAPPDHHLLVHRDFMVVARGPHENGHRPAVDALFRTAARAYGNRVVGVVLSGALDDGTAGLLSIKMRSGVAVVQDPDEAFHPSMPRSAIENVEVDQVLPLAQIPTLLAQLAHQELDNPTRPEVSHDMSIETDIAELDTNALVPHERPGSPSGLSCPHCHGVLFEVKEGELVHYRCRVGHAYSADSLLVGQSEALEGSLYAALRGLEEISTLADRVAAHARSRNQTLVMRRFQQKARDAQENAEILRELILQGDAGPLETVRATQPVPNGTAIEAGEELADQGAGVTGTGIGDDRTAGDMAN